MLVKPMIVRPGDAKVAQLRAEATAVFDRALDFIEELRELAALPCPPAIESNLADEAKFGNWVFFPWSKVLARYPVAADHFLLRTARNRPIVSDSDYQALGKARIAAFGLSVGSNAIEQLVRDGIGAEFWLGDFDVVSPTNLNRLRYSVLDVGLPKVEVLARRLWEIDPYLMITGFGAGYSSVAAARLRDDPPDLIVEAIDDLAVSFQIRMLASELRVALLSPADLADSAVLEVERHDRGARVGGGRFSRRQLRRAVEGRLGQLEGRLFLVRQFGWRQVVSVPMLRSISAVGVSVSGLPQSGNTAARAGALVALAAREILAGREAPTRRYVEAGQRVVGCKKRGLAWLVQVWRLVLSLFSEANMAADRMLRT